MDSNRKSPVMSRRNGLGFNMIVVVICGFIVIFGIYSYHDLHTRLRKGEELADRLRQQHESVSAQLQVVYEHKSRLDNSLKQEKKNHIKTRSDLEAEKEALEARYRQEKTELLDRITSINQDHNLLKGQHDDMKMENDRLQENLRKLTDEQKQIDEKHAIEAEQVRQEAQNSVVRLKDELANLNRQKEDVELQLDTMNKKYGELKMAAANPRQNEVVHNVQPLVQLPGQQQQLPVQQQQQQPVQQQQQQPVQQQQQQVVQQQQQQQAVQQQQQQAVQQPVQQQQRQQQYWQQQQQQQQNPGGDAQQNVVDKNKLLANNQILQVDSLAQRPPGGDLNRDVHRPQPKEPLNSQEVNAKQNNDVQPEVVMQIKKPGENLPHAMQDNNADQANKNGAGEGNVVQREQVAPPHIQAIDQGGINHPNPQDSAGNQVKAPEADAPDNGLEPGDRVRRDEDDRKGDDDDDDENRADDDNPDPQRDVQDDLKGDLKDDIQNAEDQNPVNDPQQQQPPHPQLPELPRGLNLRDDKEDDADRYEVDDVEERGFGDNKQKANMET